MRFYRSEEITPIFIYMLDMLDGTVATLTVAEAKQLREQLDAEIAEAEKYR